MANDLDRLEDHVIRFVDHCPYADSVKSVDRPDDYSIKVAWVSIANTDHEFVVTLGEIYRLEKSDMDPSGAVRLFSELIAGKMNLTEGFKKTAAKSGRTSRFKQRVAACGKCEMLAPDEMVGKRCQACEDGVIQFLVIDQPLMPHPGVATLVEPYSPRPALGPIAPGDRAALDRILDDTNSPGPDRGDGDAGDGGEVP